MLDVTYTSLTKQSHLMNFEISLNLCCWTLKCVNHGLFCCQWYGVRCVWLLCSYIFLDWWPSLSKLSLHNHRINWLTCLSLYWKYNCKLLSSLLISKWDNLKNGIQMGYDVQQYFNYIMAVSFIGEGHPSTRRKPLICCKSLTNFIT